MPTGSAAHRIVLPSGIRLLVEDIPFLYSAVVGVAVETGSCDDPISKEGLAHFVEHLLVRKAADLLRRLDLIGGWFEAATERECTFFFARVGRGFVEEAFQILQGILSVRDFDEADCELERNIITSEIDYVTRDYSQVCRQLMLAEMWKDRRLATPILGTVSSVQSIDRDDVSGFLDRQYRPENVLVSVVIRDRSPEEIAVLADRYFGGRFGKARAGKVACSGGEATLERELTYHHHDADADSGRVHFTLAVEALHRAHPERVTLFGLSSLLGEGSNSRLFLKIRREEGLVYDMTTSYQLFSQDGVFTISGCTSEASFPALALSLRHEIGQLINEPAGEEEIQMVQNRLRSNLMFNLENPELRMIRLAKLESWLGRLFDVEEELEMIAAVTADGIHDLAERLLGNGMNVVTLGSAVPRKASIQLTRDPRAA